MTLLTLTKGERHFIAALATHLRRSARRRGTRFTRKDLKRLINRHFGL